MFTAILKPASWTLLRSTRRCGLATLHKPLSQPEIVEHQPSPGKHQQTPKQDLYWQKTPQWKTVDTSEFLSYRWQVRARLLKVEKQAYILVQKLYQYILSTAEFHAFCPALNNFKRVINR